MPELTDPKLEAFAQGFVAELNGTKAALAAGYSEKSARTHAARLRRRPEVAARIQELMDERAARVQVKADDVLLELKRLSLVDVTQAFDSMGQLKPLHEIPEDVRRALSGIEVHEIFDGQGEDKHAIGLAKKVKFYDKTKALELLGKHLKLFTDKIEITDPVAERLKKARERVKAARG